MILEDSIKVENNVVSFIFILPTWLPTYESKNIGKILRYLQVNNIKAVVYCGPTEHKESFYLAFPDFKLIAKRNVYRWLNLIGHFQQLIYLYLVFKKYRKSQIIIWTYAGYRENLWFILMKRVFGLRIIIKNDSRILTDKSSQWGRLRDWLTHVLPAKKSDGIISETQEVFDNWNNHCGHLSRHFIYSNGANISTLKSSRIALEKKSRDKDRYKYVLVSGRLNHEKGIDLAVEAFCRVASFYPEWRMILVGEIYEDEAYIKACNLAKEYGVRERILWKPFCDGHNLYKHYHNSAIFLNASRNEGLPNRFIEAMYFKCAVLSFDVGQCKYLLSMNRGVIVENGNLELFTYKLKELLADQKLRESFGQRASMFIENEFNDELNLPLLVQWMIGSAN